MKLRMRAAAMRRFLREARGEDETGLTAAGSRSGEEPLTGIGEGGRYEGGAVRRPPLVGCEMRAEDGSSALPLAFWRRGRRRERDDGRREVVMLFFPLELASLFGVELGFLALLAPALISFSLVTHGDLSFPLGMLSGRVVRIGSDLIEQPPSEEGTGVLKRLVDKQGLR